MAARLLLSIADGAAAADAEGVDGETAADVAGADAEADVAPACRTRQTLTRSIGFRPTSTKLPRNTPTSILLRRCGSTRTVPRKRPSLPSARLPWFAGAMRTPWMSLMTTRVSLAMTMKASRPRNPIREIPRLPASRKRSSRTDRPWVTLIHV